MRIWPLPQLSHLRTVLADAFHFAFRIAWVFGAPLERAFTDHDEGHGAERTDAPAKAA